MSKTNVKNALKTNKAGVKNNRRPEVAGKPAQVEAAKPDIPPTVEIVTGQRRPERAAKPKAEPRPKGVSALDAAAEVLRTATGPMSCKALIDAMAQRGLWASPHGKTPDATLYAAIMREINAKGAAARFRKTDRGKFAVNA